jgi:hypothetical protein
MTRYALALFLVGCVGADSVPAEPEALEHAFPTLSVDPGGELNFICQSWTLGNDEPLYVNATTVTGGPGWHHTNWLFAPEGDFAGPDDTWNCEDRGFELVAAGISGGVLFAPSPELYVARQAFAPDVAIVIPPRSKIIAEVHLINPSETTLTTHTNLELSLLRPEEARVHLQPLAISNYALDLPAQSKSSFSTSCDMVAVEGGELAFGMYSIEPHYHDLGEGMRVEALASDGSTRMIHEAAGRIGNKNLGKVLDEPFDLRPFTGLRMTCNFQNTRAQRVGFGSDATAEMCVMFGFTDSQYKWIGGSLAGSPSTESVAEHPTFSSPCSMLTVRP